MVDYKNDFNKRWVLKEIASVKDVMSILGATLNAIVKMLGKDIEINLTDTDIVSAETNQALTDLEISQIENEQATTDLEIAVLELQKEN